MSKAAMMRAFEKALDKVVRSSSFRKIAEDLVVQIRKRTRLGYGVKEGGKQNKLTKLSDSYKEYRKKNKGKLSNQTTPSKSNLTLTGEMLDSMQVKVEGGTIVVSFGTKFAGQKAKWVTTAKEQRRFLDLTTGERKQIAEEIRQLIIKELTR